MLPALYPAIHEKVNAAKSRPSFTRVRGRGGGGGRGRGEDTRGIDGEKESGDFRPFETLVGRRGEREILRTRLKTCVYVCRYIPALLPISQKHPSLSKATLRCRLQDSKFVLDKQNKHASAGHRLRFSSLHSVFHFLSLRNKESRDFLPLDINLRYIFRIYSSKI